MSTGQKLPAGWVWTTLGELTDPCILQAPPSSKEFAYIEISSIDNETKTIRTPSHLPAGNAPTRARQHLRAGDVVLSMTRPNLNAVARISEKFDGAIGSTGLCVLRPVLVDSHWLFYLTQSPPFVEAMTRRVQGVVYPAVRPADILSFAVPLPPLEEQKRLVAEVERQLTRLFSANDSLKRTQANLKRYRAAVLKAACEGRLVPTEAELAGMKVEAMASTTQPAPTTHTIPPGWRWTTLPYLGKLARGKSKHRPRNDPKLYGGPYPFIQTGDIRNSHGWIRSYEATYNEVGLAQSQLWPPGTLCITIAANIAETAILTFAACFPDSVVGFTYDGDFATVRYVELFLRTIKERLESLAPATAQKNINLETLSRIPIPLPPAAEQKRIVAEVDRRFSVLDELEKVVQDSLRRAETLRQTVLRSAFTGKLAPQDPADAPASALLERIHQESTAESDGHLRKRSRRPVGEIKNPRRRRAAR